MSSCQRQTHPILPYNQDRTPVTLLYRHPDFLQHDTGRHPENAGRLRAIDERLDQSGLPGRCSTPEWAPATLQELLRVHTPGHLDALDALAHRGGGQVDSDTVVSPASMDVARLAAGAATDAVRRVVAGEDRTVLCIGRPPGHHATADRAMGFCLLNHAAIAAQAAVAEHGLDRVLIIDWDVHHGNGTQELFYGASHIGYFSIHRWPFWPGTGAADETGAGDGLGATRNLPVEMGESRDRFLSYFARELEAFADQIKPQLVVLSAGFDAHRADPVGSLGLETEDFVSLTQTVKDVAAAHAGDRLVSLLEGGYNAPVLAECVAVHLEELLDA
ncbi:histone deacetylase family protein [Posidoniimonas corsicana]|nr:histone deacetylase [Posidoniimonas corsicana]